MSDNFDELINRVQTLRGVLKGHQEQLIINTNFNKDGSISRAPHFSKRGFAVETHHAFTLIENYISNMGDLNGIHVATDRVAYNGPILPRNDQYRDIIVNDLTNKISKSYQSKVCKDATSSIIAATNPKYINAGVIPLVSSDHWKEYSTIGGINVNGKTITSDALTLREADAMTKFYENGGYIHDFGDSKMRVLHMNAVKQGAAQGAKSAFVNRAITEAIGYLTTTNEDPKTALKTCSSMIASTIDGAVRGALVNDSAFKNNPKIAKCIAENSYSIAKDCLNYVASGGKNGSMSQILTKGGDGTISSVFSTIGRNLGSRFGPIGSYLGRVIGSGVGNTIVSIVSANPFGKTALSALGASVAYNGLLGGAVKQVEAIAVAGVAKLASGVKTLVSSIGAFAATHPLLMLGFGLISLLLLDGGPSPFEIIRQERDKVLNEINDLFTEFQCNLSYDAKNNFKSLSSMFYKMALRNSVSELISEIEPQTNELSKISNKTIKLEALINKTKNGYINLSKELPNDNVFTFIVESFDWSDRRFYSQKQIMEMAQ